MPRLLPTEIFAELDRHFAALVERLAGGSRPGLQLAAALVSRERRAGHLCLHLPSVAGRPLPELPQIACPPLAPWLAELRAAAPVVGPPGAFSPLILDPAGRLYLQRYWAYEDRLARAVLQRAAIFEPCDEARLRTALDALFPVRDPAPDDQRLAAETAARRRLCLITGGPGTGKTRTLVRILALLLQLRDPGAPALRFELAAPTGKAAARIQEEVRRAAAALPAGPLTDALLALEARTLHRLLGARPDQATFRHNAQNPIAADVVVVDEASMVDLALMAKLLDATLPAARLILLGDKDQLASVEAGAVLADLCAGLSPDPSPIGNSAITELRRNYRFPATSAIHRLSTAINAGDPAAALAALAGSPEVTVRPLPSASPGSAALHAQESLGRSGTHPCLPPAGTGSTRSLTPLAPMSLAGALAPLLLAAWPAQLPANPADMLACLSRFRVLCAVREGPFGVRRFNELAEDILARAGRIHPLGQHYSGRPILITRNDHALRLFNGDVGVLLPAPEGGGLRAWFPSPDGGVRSLLPARLPAHETVFAMTVHKSQGSEFGSILLVLPDRDSPVLTRELLYTGLTRAREHAELWFNEAIFRAAVLRRVERHSGLRDALVGTGSTRSPTSLPCLPSSETEDYGDAVKRIPAGHC
jgi:exodeoxyribonuclease V alpha subunit